MTTAPRTRPPCAACLLELGQVGLSAMVASTAAAGFVLARPDPLPWAGLLGTAAGVFLASAAANTLNQVLERDLDARVPRTRTRPLPSGRMGARGAVIFAATAALVGLACLALAGGPRAAALGLGNIALYVAVYTPLKTRTSLATVVGAVVGAVPPVIGWVAATGHLAPGAGLLAALLFAWQIPHALAQAWPERTAAAEAGYRTLPAVDPGGALTSASAVIWAAALLPLGLAATATGMAGHVYGVGSVALAAPMVLAGLLLWHRRSDASARRLFRASLIYLPVLLLLMLVDGGPTASLAAAPPDAPAPAGAP